MYKPHKQNSIQEELNQIETLVYKSFVDKYEVMKLLNCSEKTADRRLIKLSYKHTLRSTIEMLREFEFGVSSKDLAVRYNCSEVNINAVARSHNIKRLNPIGFINRIKSDFKFFDDIDTEEKAYILGFFAADGHLTKKNEMKIALACKDVDILEKIKKEMRSEVIIRKYLGKLTTFNNGKQYQCSDVVVFSICNYHLANSLRNLGFDNKKTISCRFPNIPKELYLHFIRGYFDGDGSMTRSFGKDGYTKYSSNICGTESFLLFVKNYLESEYNCKFNSKLSKKYGTENCCYLLTMSGNKNVKHFLNLIYKDSNIYLDRKYNKYLDLTS